MSKNNKGMSIRGYYNVSTHRPTSWYWKKNLNVEAWEGPLLPDDLKQFAVER